MDGDPDEVPLPGGRVTQGMVRVGGTVRRPLTADAGFVHRLLRHLATKGFDGVPVSLGRNEQRRDVLSFIEGDVPADLGHHDDATLRQAASLIRRFHDLTADLVGDPLPRASEGDVICHNDL